MTTPLNQISVFLSYAHEDKVWVKKLETHLSSLKRQGIISTWYDQKIVPGTNRADVIDQQLKQASIILLLVSADFLASDYYDQIEAEHVLERQKFGTARLVPIIIRDCDWKNSPLAHLAVLPDTGRPLTEWGNRDAAFSNIVAGIRRVVSELTQSSQQESPPSQSQVWNVPYPRNPYFTGRDDLLNRLEQQLTPATQNDPIATRSAALTQPQAIKGLGGIGKTQIAVEYAYRSLDQGYYTYTLWMNAASEDTMITSFVTIAKLLPSFSVKNETDQRKLIEAVKYWLEQCEQRWLLIFDNADDIALVQNYLPLKGKNGSILLTTRADAAGALAAPVEVETMGFVEGTHLLLRRAQRFEHVSHEEFNQAGNIVIALDHFPLALDQAGAFIEKTQCSFVEYLHIYRTHGKDLLAERGLQTTNYPESVATTWLLSFEKVEQANPAAAELLRLCAFLAPDMIPEELIKEGAAHWTPLLRQAASDLFTFNQMIAELLKFSLVKRLTETQALSTHRLVQAVQKDMMKQDEQYQWAERVIQAVNGVFPDDPGDIVLWPRCLRYLDQVQACYTLVEQHVLQFTEVVDLFTRTGRYLDSQALYTIAEPLCQRALAICEQQLGATHLGTSYCLTILAFLYYHQGKYEEAEPLYQRALAIDEQQLGATHPSTATSLCHLALLYHGQGKYEEAELLYQRALAIYEQKLGATHLSRATALNGLALLYHGQGKYGKAEPLHQRALAIFEQKLGAKHPDTAQSLNNLAENYRYQGKYGKAEPLYRRALANLEQQLGTTHPDTATSLSNLALLYDNQGRYEEAEPLYQRVLAIFEQKLGAKHLDTATSLNNLAGIYDSQGKYEEAEPLYQRALAIREQKLGAKHPDTTRSLNNLAGLYDSQGRYEEAEPLHQRALAIREQQLGPEHPDTAQSLNNLAENYRYQGKYGKAEPLYRRALAICEQKLGAKHPSTATGLSNLALLYDNQGRYEEAEPLYRRALAICEQKLGAKHPSTATVLRNLAGLYRDQGRYEEAELLYQRALTIREQSLGPDHPRAEPGS